MIEPYYQRDGITIYHGDCREVLPALAVDGVDVTIADPPYGETSLAWDRRVEGWLDLLPRVPLWCFGSLRFFMEEAGTFAAARFKIAQDVIWEKHNGTGFATDRFRRVHEQILQLYPRETPWGEVRHETPTTADATRKTIRRKALPAQWQGERGASTYRSEDGGPRIMRSVIRVRSTHAQAQHDTQKPVGIVLPLIEYSCPPGGLALDPFSGSGTTLVAARLAGRRAIGIELLESNCAIAVERLRQGVLLP